MTSEIAEIRAFNRFYTRQIGLLEEHFAEGPLSLAEARVLYEIDAHGNVAGRDLVRALRIDRGYLSRMLTRFTDAGLVAISPRLDDRRSNSVALTADGDLLARRLNRNSDDAVSGMVHALAADQRAELVAAMTTVRRLLGDSLPDMPIVLRPHRIGDLGWLVHRQGVLYNQQFGRNGEFEALIAGLYRDFALAPPDAPPRALWIAERAGRIVGSVFVIGSDRANTAQLRMLYVEPDQRGNGLGRLLVDTATAFGRDQGYARMRLWTQSVLVSARRIYQAAGFVLAESAPHHSFGQDLIGEYWEKELGNG